MTSFRERLTQEKPLFGSLITLASLETAEIMAGARFDWLFIDLEHSSLDIATTQHVLQVVRPVDCLIRIPLNEEAWMKKALDTGAAGVIVPQVNSAEEAARTVRWAKYPPRGSRSVGLSRAQGYGADLAEYIQRADDDTAVVIQVETLASIDTIHEILKVPGIDAVFLGPYDLSASMGYIGQVAHPAVQMALSNAHSACQASGMPVGIFSASPAGALKYARMGYKLIAVASDVLFLGSAVRGARSALNDP